jgi:hypothetical protein
METGSEQRNTRSISGYNLVTPNLLPLALFYNPTSLPTEDARENSRHDMTEPSYFSASPICRYCDFPTHRVITRLDNEIGNVGRPFYTCTTKDCGQYFCFDDARGIEDTDPACHCGRPYRRRIGGVAPHRSSYLVVQCATSACSFNEIEHDGDWKMTIPLSAIPAAVAEGRL